MKLYTKEHPDWMLERIKQLEALIEEVIEAYDDRARSTCEIQAEAEKIVKEFISKL